MNRFEESYAMTDSPLRVLFVSFMSYVSDFISLTKPKVISLLLVSTCCPMILASGGSVSVITICFTLLGGALISGSACAINCIWERETDALMQRTKDRPLAAGRLSPFPALIFALVIGVAGFLVLWFYLNPFAAGIALSGHLFYVFVYTMWLKPWTPQNIVIGGAAGAVPPLVGWAAVTGTLDLTAVLLFLVVFLWTPPHFWALALNKNQDYKRAGIPMLPVVAGEAVTHNQMLFYSILLIPVCILLVMTNDYLGWLSFIGMGTLSLIFTYKIIQLKRLIHSTSELRTKKAWDVFGFSLIYLAMFFFCLVIDSTIF
jgi:heme o synthase